MVKLERIYTVPLGDAYDVSRNKRVPRAVKILRTFIARHMKADGEKVTLSEALNKHLWRSSIQRPPRRVKVRLIKDEGFIRAYLADEKIEAPKKKEEKKPEKKEEPKKEEKHKEGKKPKEVPKKEEKPKEAPKEEKKTEEKNR
jgi:large subunit ribosomal protein L31e